MSQDRVVDSAKAAWGHARGCKKLLSECKVCQWNVIVFAEIPLPKLAELLGEAPHRNRFPAMEVITDKVIDAYTRSKESSRRQWGRIATERAAFTRLCKEVQDAGSERA